MPSDEPTALAPDAPEEASNASPDYSEPDHVLTVLVDLINGMPGLEIGLTLYVGGSIVSGVVTSGNSYFKLLREQIAGDGTDGTRAALAKALGEYADTYPEPRTEAQSDEGHGDGDGDNSDEDSRVTAYVHMRAVSVHTPGSAGTLEQGLWRSRLTRVDGWSIGNFGAKPSLARN